MVCVCVCARARDCVYFQSCFVDYFCIVHSMCYDIFQIRCQ